MKNQDYRTLTLEEAVNWTKEKCLLDDVRMRMKSRSVAFILFHSLCDAVQYISHLEAKIKELENDKK
jgi:hypothetical protein